jgi:predicted kinase
MLALILFVVVSLSFVLAIINLLLNLDYPIITTEIEFDNNNNDVEIETNPEMIILCGIPGSGKSTFAKGAYPHYVYINQDTEGSRKKCEQLTIAALEAGKNVIIDRCNVTTAQRKVWIDLALQHGYKSIKAIWLDVPAEECIARIVARKEHPNLGSKQGVDKIRQVVYNFGSDEDNEYPVLREGLNEVIYKRNW